MDTEEELQEVAANFPESLPSSFPAWTQYLPLFIQGILFPPLAGLYRVKFERNSQLSDLQKSIQFAFGSLAATRRDHPTIYHYKQRLASALRNRYRILWEAKDLNLTLSLRRSIVDRLPDGHPDTEWHTQALTTTYEDLFEQQREDQVLDQLIQLHISHLEKIAPGHPQYGRWCSSLGRAYRRKFNAGHDDVLQASLDWSLKGLAEVGPDPEDIRYRKMGVSDAYAFLYNRDQKRDDLELTIFWWWSAIGHTKEGSKEYHELRIGLIPRYRALWRDTKYMDHLNAAIKFGEESVSTNPTPINCNDFGSVYFDRYGALGSTKDLDKALEWQLKSVRIAKKGDPSLGLCYGALGGIYLDRHREYGQLDDLESCLKWTREAVKTLPPRHEQFSRQHLRLASAYRQRLRRHRNPQDLDLAFESVQTALSMISDKHPVYVEALDLLSSIYQDRFHQLRDPQDLHSSLSKLEELDQLLPPHHHYRDGVHFSLSNVHSDIYKYIGGPDRFKHRVAIIDHLKLAVSHASPGNPNLLVYKYQLARELFEKYIRLREASDLEEAFIQAEAALELAPSHHPKRVACFQLLGDLYSERWSLDRGDVDRDRALDSYAQCATIQNAEPSAFWRGAVTWARFGDRTESPRSLDAYASLFKVLPELLWVGSSVTSRHETMVKYGITEVTSNAILASIRHGNLSLAIEFLEQSLGITFQQLSDLREDTASLLEIQFPSHANLLRSISKQLYDAAVSSLDTTHGLKVDEAAWDKQRKLAIERTQLLKTIREFPGFDDFLLPRRFDRLATAAAEGPVIIVTCSGIHADALIVFPDKSTAHVPLPHVVEVFIREQLHQLRLALQYNMINTRGTSAQDLNPEGEVEVEEEGGDQLRGGMVKGGVRQNGARLINAVLAWIWEYIVSPVFEALKSRGYENGRIWWCLTGQARNLPVHAAGPPNDYIQSYTSSLGALINARERKATTPIPSDSTIVTAVCLSEFGTGRSQTLKFVEEEMEEVKTIAGADHCRIILNDQATVPAVLEQLPQARWLHLACHGKQGNARNPLESSLVLYNDERLAMSKLISTSIPYAEFVFLSACETAMGDSDLANESLHIAGAMIFAGFKAAIGTLWSISDKDGPKVTRAVYSHVFQPNAEPDVRKTAEALHLVIREMRESGTPAHRWVPFIHIGI